jgi:hypothetical protein
VIVENLIRVVGIVQWGNLGDDDKWKNQSPDIPGIYQTPGQLAPALVYLSRFNLNLYAEVGVFHGANFVFVSEYLRRFNPGVRCLGIDPTDYPHPEIRELIASEGWMSYEKKTSDDFKGRRFDLVFIDGDHENGWPARDWQNLGKAAGICMIHDIQEPSCPECIELWNSVKNTKGKLAVEFTDNAAAVSQQGTGILHDRGLKS